MGKVHHPCEAHIFEKQNTGYEVKDNPQQNMRRDVTFARYFFKFGIGSSDIAMSSLCKIHLLTDKTQHTLLP